MNLFGVLIRVSERWQSALLNFAVVVFECTFVCLSGSANSRHTYISSGRDVLVQPDSKSTLPLTEMNGNEHHVSVYSLTVSLSLPVP